MAFDRVEHVALATDEAFGLLVRSPGTDAVHCIASPTDHAVEVTLSAEGAAMDIGDHDGWEDELAIRVLRGVSDEVECAARFVSFRVRG